MLTRDPIDALWPESLETCDADHLVVPHECTAHCVSATSPLRTAGPGRGGAECPFDLAQRDDRDVESSNRGRPRSLALRDDQPVRAPGVAAAERGDAGRVESLLGALALDGDRIGSPAEQHEVHLVLRLVPPVVDAERRAVRVNLVQEEVLHEDADVVGAQLAPSAVVADEPRVEPEDAGSGDDLRPSSLRVGADDVGHGGRLENGKVVGDRGAAHPAVPREARGVEDPAAADEDELEEPLEGDLAELIVYRTALATPQYARVDAYLRKKYGFADAGDGGLWDKEAGTKALEAVTEAQVKSKGKITRPTALLIDKSGSSTTSWACLA